MFTEGELILFMKDERHKSKTICNNIVVTISFELAPMSVVTLLPAPDSPAIGSASGGNNSAASIGGTGSGMFLRNGDHVDNTEKMI